MAKKQNQADLLQSRCNRVVSPKQPSASPEGRSEGRKKPRTRTFKEAVLISQTGVRIPVVVSNCTDAGARVDFARGGPDIFGNVVLLQPSLNLNKRGRVVWKNQNSAGLEFEEP